MFVDLMPDVVEIEDQLYTSSCTANAGVSAMELIYHRALKVKLDFSRAFLYWYEREIEGKLGQDTGARMDSIGKVLVNRGVCFESTMPFDIMTQPSVEADAEAVTYKINSFNRLLSTDAALLSQIRSLLDKGSPVLASIKCCKSFQEIKNGAWNDKNPQWSWEISETNPIVGNHAVLIIGYDDEARELLIQNSWGPNWGDGGFCGFPYDAMKTMMRECYSINARVGVVVPVLPTWKQRLLETLFRIKVTLRSNPLLLAILVAAVVGMIYQLVR